MNEIWSPDFERIPDEPWVARSVEDLALNYDTVENHGWYSNLDHTVEKLASYARPGDLLIDYSGGTGILTRRLLDRIGRKRLGIIIADSSPKFLRLALEKLRDEERVAFRRIRYLKDEGRLQRLDGALDPATVERGADAVVSTNAIHLYYDLEETVSAWRRVIKPTGRLFVQSGNVRHPDMPDDEWIIDETVEVIHAAAMEIVREDDALARYRSVLDDEAYMAAHDELRRKYFLPVRPLETYLDVFRRCDFDITSIERRRIPARVDEWFEFLSVYHEGVLGWVGGAERVTGATAPPAEAEARIALMRRAMDRVFAGAYEFGASWTYVTGEPRV